MRTAVVLAAAAVLLPGCRSSAKPLRVDGVPTASTAACRRWHDALPPDLGPGTKRRRVTPDDPHVAAYGDPPIVLRCGAPQHGTYQAGDQTFDLNGVRWFPEERPGGVVVWSLPTSFVNVEATVPAPWTGDRLGRLAGAVQAANP